MTDNSLDLRDRSALVREFEATHFDVLIVGGGITGAGIARDAALRGLSVGLIEAKDFASGTSSRSSKLIHGGLRYLAQGDLGVVKEAARERRVLRAIAPHLAQTNPMIVPAKSIAGLTKLRAGLWAYEKLGEVAADETFAVWDRKTLVSNEPTLASAGLSGAIVYPEYLTDDARLVIANIRSAVAAGAKVMNYARLKSISAENGQARGGKVCGNLPGETFEFGVRAQIVVNAAGPWVDDIRRMSDPGAESKLQLTEGIHLVFDGKRIPIGRTLVLNAHDKRSIFAIPRDGLVYAGTTDTFTPQPDYWPDFAESDVSYLLSTLNAALSIPALTEHDILSAWAGLRPLISEKGKSPSEISRRDEIMVGSDGTLAIAGGKLTAYRRMAERIVDVCAQRLNRNTADARTADLALPGGDDADIEGMAERLVGEGMSAREAGRLVRLYGSESPAIQAAGGGIGGEIIHAVTKEGAVTLEDYWFRRSARAWFGAAPNEKDLLQAAEKMGSLMAWGPSRTEEEARRVMALLPNFEWSSRRKAQ